MAFVVVLHLSPVHESSAAAIFQQSTTMPVQQVTGHTKIERNHVYVIPPNQELKMVDGALDIAPHERTGGPPTVIDIFFRTLAKQHKTRAVGIVPQPPPRTPNSLPGLRVQLVDDMEDAHQTFGRPAGELRT